MHAPAAWARRLPTAQPPAGKHPLQPVQPAQQPWASPAPAARGVALFWRARRRCWQSLRRETLSRATPGASAAREEARGRQRRALQPQPRPAAPPGRQRQRPPRRPREAAPCARGMRQSPPRQRLSLALPKTFHTPAGRIARQRSVRARRCILRASGSSESSSRNVHSAAACFSAPGGSAGIAPPVPAAPLAAILPSPARRPGVRRALAELGPGAGC